MPNILYLNQFKTTTLSVVGGIDDSQTTGIVIQSVSGLDTTKPGIACLTYTDPLDLDNAEYIEYTAINSTTKTFTGVTRGAEGYSAKSHSNGVTVAFPVSESHVNRLADAVSIGADPTNPITGVLDEDTMSSDSAVKVPTQQSVKAYVDASVTTDTSDTTPTPTGGKKRNEYYMTALAGAAEFQAPSGTPANGNTLVIRVKDDGTNRALTYNAIYRAIGITLPTTTTANKTTYIGAIYNSTDSKWDCVATGTEA